MFKVNDSSNESTNNFCNLYSRLKARVVSTVKPNLNMANRQALTSVLCFTLCHFVLVFFSPFSIAISSLGEEKATISSFRTFVRFMLVWICLFPLPLGVWEELRFVIVALPGLFSYLSLLIRAVFFTCSSSCYVWKILSGVMIDLLKGRGEWRGVVS